MRGACASLLAAGALPWLVALCVPLSGCEALGLPGSQLGAAACPELRGNVNALAAGYARDARANAKIRAFVQAAKDMAEVSARVEASAAAACQRIGADLGMSSAELAPRNELGGKASGACNAVAARIDGILRQGFSISVSVKPPACQANLQAEASCNGACDVNVDEGRIVAECEPARLSGSCQGRCTGRCDGRCVGGCRGQCSAYDAQGRCIGGCAGECDGSCEGTCHARCQGTWQSPRCEGYVRPPSGDAECQASCRAHANARAACSPPLVAVQPTSAAPAALALAASLQRHLPELLHAELTLGRRLLADAQTVAQVGAQLPRIVGQAGAHALACAAGAADLSASASVRLQVSVRASAGVTGRVGATSG